MIMLIRLTSLCHISYHIKSNIRVANMLLYNIMCGEWFGLHSVYTWRCQAIHNGKYYILPFPIALIAWIQE